MSKKIRRRKKRIRLLSLSFILVAGIVLLSFAAKEINKNKEAAGDKGVGTVSEAEEPKKAEIGNYVSPISIRWSI